jgi:hypothetical protein
MILLASQLLLKFPFRLFWAVLLWLASPDVLVLSCAAVGLQLLKFFPLLIYRVPGVARVSALPAAPTDIEFPSANVVSNVSGVFMLLGVPAAVGVPAVAGVLLLLASKILLTSF